jgi:hypothetical protein
MRIRTRAYVVVALLLGASLGCGASTPRAEVAQTEPAPVAAAQQPGPQAAAPAASTPAAEPAPQPGALQVTAAPAAPALDLESVTPVPLAAPPFQYEVIAETRVQPSTPAPKLVQLRATAADPTRSLDPAPYQASEPYFLAPIENGALPAGARADIPTHYAGAALHAIIPSGEHLLLIYGGRYLVVTRGDAVLHVFDLDAFRHPPRADPQWQEFAVQDVTYAQIAGDTLYVCNGGGSYAREVFGKKGFVSALDLATGTLRWRSDALVCNATFAVYGDYLITGYGFTAEPDFVFVLRLSDGKTLSKTRVASGPDTITLDGNRLQVETYDHSYEFELR